MVQIYDIGKLNQPKFGYYSYGGSTTQPGSYVPPYMGVGGAAGGSTGSATGGGLSAANVAGRSPYDALIAQAKASLSPLSKLVPQAQASAQAQVNAQLAALNKSSALEQQQYKDLQNRAQGFALALGQLNQQGAPAVGEAYQNAANALGSLGTGLTGAVASDEQAYADKARAQVAGLIGDQNAGLVGGYDIPGLRSTSQYTGVTLPGKTLGEQAAAYVQEMNAQALESAGRVGLIAGDYATQAVQALKQREADRANIVAQMPSLREAALEASRKDRQDTLSTLASLTQAKTNYGFAARKETFAEKAAKAKAVSDAKQQAFSNALATTAITHVDPLTGRPVAGYVEVKLPKGGTTVIPYSQYEATRQFGVTLSEKQREFDKTYGQNQQTIDINKQRADAYAKAQLAKGNKVAAYDPSLSKQVGYLVDKNRQPMLDANGKRIPYKNTAAKTGGLTAGEIATATKGVASDIKAGLKPSETKTYDPNNANADSSGYVHTNVPSQSYTKALEQGTAKLIAAGLPAQTALRKATTLVNAAYGTPTQIADKLVRSAKSGGMGMTDALKAILAAEADGTAQLPIDQYIASLSRVYGRNRATVRETLRQLSYLVSTGQITLGAPGGNQ